MAREGTCEYCDGSTKTFSYDIGGKKLCSATCAHDYQQELNKRERAKELQPVLYGVENDECDCAVCKGDTS